MRCLCPGGLRLSPNSLRPTGCQVHVQGYNAQTASRENFFGGFAPPSLGQEVCSVGTSPPQVFDDGAVNHIQALSAMRCIVHCRSPYRCWASSYRCLPQPTWAAYRRVLVEPDLNDQRAAAASPCRPSQPVPASSRPYDARRAVQRRQGRNLGIFPIIFRLSCSGEGCSSPLAVGVYRARTWGFFWQRARVARNRAPARGGHRGGGSRQSVCIATFDLTGSVHVRR